MKHSRPYERTHLCQNIFHFCLFLCCALLVRHKLLQVSCKQEKYVVSLYCGRLTDPNLKLGKSGGSSSMNVCPPTVLIMSIQSNSTHVIRATLTYSWWVVLVCHRENNRSFAPYFLCLKTGNWKQHLTPSQKSWFYPNARTDSVQQGWTAFHFKAQHPPWDTNADSDAEISHSHLKKAMWLFRSRDSRFTSDGLQKTLLSMMLFSVQRLDGLPLGFL